jgi:hypothetical protein
MNVISINHGGKNLLDEKSILEDKYKPSYELKLGCCKSTFRYFCLKKQINKKFSEIDLLMKKVISLENLAKISKNYIIMKNLILEDYQCKIIDLI